MAGLKGPFFLLVTCLLCFIEGAHGIPSWVPGPLRRVIRRNAGCSVAASTSSPSPPARVHAFSWASPRPDSVSTHQHQHRAVQDNSRALVVSVARDNDEHVLAANQGSSSCGGVSSSSTSASSSSSSSVEGLLVAPPSNRGSLFRRPLTDRLLPVLYMLVRRVYAAFRHLHSVARMIVAHLHNGKMKATTATTARTTTDNTYPHNNTNNHTTPAAASSTSELAAPPLNESKQMPMESSIDNRTVIDSNEPCPSLPNTTMCVEQQQQQQQQQQAPPIQEPAKKRRRVMPVQPLIVAFDQLVPHASQRAPPSSTSAAAPTDTSRSSSSSTTQEGNNGDIDNNKHGSIVVVIMEEEQQEGASPSSTRDDDMKDTVTEEEHEEEHEGAADGPVAIDHAGPAGGAEGHGNGAESTPPPPQERSTNVNTTIWILLPKCCTRSRKTGNLNLLDTEAGRVSVVLITLVVLWFLSGISFAPPPITTTRRRKKASDDADQAARDRLCGHWECYAQESVDDSDVVCLYAPEVATPSSPLAAATTTTAAATTTTTEKTTTTSSSSPSALTPSCQRPAASSVRTRRVLFRQHHPEDRFGVGPELFVSAFMEVFAPNSPPLGLHYKFTTVLVVKMMESPLESPLLRHFFQAVGSLGELHRLHAEARLVDAAAYNATKDTFLQGLAPRANSNNHKHTVLRLAIHFTAVSVRCCLWTVQQRHEDEEERGSVADVLVPGALLGDERMRVMLRYHNTTALPQLLQQTATASSRRGEQQRRRKKNKQQQGKGGKKGGRRRTGSTAGVDGGVRWLSFVITQGCPSLLRVEAKTLGQSPSVIPQHALAVNNNNNKKMEQGGNFVGGVEKEHVEEEDDGHVLDSMAESQTVHQGKEGRAMPVPDDPDNSE